MSSVKAATARAAAAEQMDGIGFLGFKIASMRIIDTHTANEINGALTGKSVKQSTENGIWTKDLSILMVAFLALNSD